ncbi:DHA2 family efflux MFS transporter permease subunit [Corynebacterium sp. USCH3]|uniref:DHA2 family efflux MFS transporter permease subunit n=1 Tax=Corynebacterium sp. USCH3 TaxID=3024840 RepID=UPI0030AA623F
MTPEVQTGRRWLGLIALALGVALIVVDTTIVNVITPSVIDDLGINSSQAQWVQESYAIVFAALLLVAGRIADLRGARFVFLVGVIVFGASSLMAGVAGSGEILILARFIQGVGAAMVLPTTLALLNHMFTGKARGQAFAVWGGTIGAATALGPALGGWLSEHASWRWAFGINIPLTLVIIALTVTFIAPSPRTRGRVDLTGAVLSVLGLGLLAFGAIEGRIYGWLTSNHPFSLVGMTWNSGPSPAFTALVVGTVLLVFFTLRQVRLSRSDAGEEPLMNTRLFSIASFRNGNIATLIIGLGEYGIIAVMPLWLQFTLDYSPLQAGLALVPIALGSFIASGISFPMSERFSALSFVRVGLLLEIAGLVGLGVVAATTDAQWAAIAAVLFLYGIGVGFATAQVTNVVLEEISEEEGGQGSAIQSTFRQLGSALGIAALTTVFFSTITSSLRSTLTDSGMDTEQADELSKAVADSAGAAIASLGENPETATVADAARDAMTHGLALGSYLAAGFLVLGVVATFLIPRSSSVDDAGDAADTNGPTPTHSRHSA